MTIERDAFGGITRLVDSVGREITFTLNTAGLITDITDPLGRTVHYGYNSDQRLETVTDPAGGMTRYAYDAQGKILTITNARGIVSAHNQIGNGSEALGGTMGGTCHPPGTGRWRSLGVRVPLLSPQMRSSSGLWRRRLLFPTCPSA